MRDRVIYFVDMVPFFSLGQNHLIVPFASTSCPNLGLENVAFLGQKNEVLKTVDIWLQGRIDFFHATLRKSSFSC